MQAYYQHLQKALVKHFNVDEDMPFSELPEQFKQALYFGTNGTPIKWISGINGPAAAGKVAKPFDGLVPQMQRLYEQTQSEFTRNRIRSFMTYEPCKVCNAARLKPKSSIPHNSQEKKVANTNSIDDHLDLFSHCSRG